MEDKNNKQEKRSVKRIQKSLIIQFSVDSGDPLTRKWDVSSIRDISEKGVSFLASGKIALGDLLQMLIKIPLRPFEWFEVSGKVVAREEPKIKREDNDFNVSVVRVIFTDLKEEQKMLIREYIAWCLLKDGGKK
ncbi:MAG: PilZ domain-containing protein [Candidatus Omnitrophica bacterium]|nr:PilZ domain-containing protein [Candidatus Omnitrophota bacterium]MDD5027216.1 PilZ domain-containing protein [Candidatus Omnitrophota bacterium]MDD5661728.1 PilZ domain-containing protein [Candidatus Omnitrophota bacterium]